MSRPIPVSRVFACLTVLAACAHVGAAEPDWRGSIADPAERKRRILLKQFYVSGIIGTFRAALSGSIMTTPTEIGHFVSEELLPRIAPHMQMPSQSETAQQPAASPQAQ